MHITCTVNIRYTSDTCTLSVRYMHSTFKVTEECLHSTCLVSLKKGNGVIGTEKIYIQKWPLLGPAISTAKYQLGSGGAPKHGFSPGHLKNTQKIFWKHAKSYCNRDFYGKAIKVQKKIHCFMLNAIFKNIQKSYQKIFWKQAKLNWDRDFYGKTIKVQKKFNCL